MHTPNDFFLRYSPATAESLAGFFSLIAQIRDMLGPKAYELDDYLRQILSTAASLSPTAAAEEACDDFSDLFSTCIQIAHRSPNARTSAYHDVLAQAAARQHSSGDSYWHCVFSLAEAFPYVFNGLTQDYNQKLELQCTGAVDLVDLCCTHRVLCDIAGAEIIAQLDRALTHLFFISPVGDIYAQELLHQYLMLLQGYDKRTKKTVFETKVESLTGL